MGKAIRWIAGSLVALALVAGGTWLCWTNPNAPKRDDLNLKPSSSPARHVEPAVPAGLQTELDKLGYTAQKPITNDNEAHSTYQIWTSPDKPVVELNDLGSGIYRLHTFSFAGGAGNWKNFWCAPDGDDKKLLEHTMFFSYTVRNDFENDRADVVSDVETLSSGAKSVRWADLAGQWTLTCYVSNS